MFSEGLGGRHLLHHSIQRLSELLQLLQTRKCPGHLLDVQLDGGQDVLLPAQCPLTTHRQTERHLVNTAALRTFITISQHVFDTWQQDICKMSRVSNCPQMDTESNLSCRHGVLVDVALLQQWRDLLLQAGEQ